MENSDSTEKHESPAIATFFRPVGPVTSTHAPQRPALFQRFPGIATSGTPEGGVQDENPQLVFFYKKENSSKPGKHNISSL